MVHIGKILVATDFSGAANAAVKRAVRMKHGLIVVGKRGESTREPGLLGTVAKHVADDALCDVLVTE